MRLDADIEILGALSSIHKRLPWLKSPALMLDSELDHGFGNMISDAPFLRKVELSAFGLQRLALPWSQLTSLHVDRFSVTQFAEIIRWTPNLVDLVIDDRLHRSYAPGPRPYFTSRTSIHHFHRVVPSFPTRDHFLSSSTTT
ncbi:hypothetical protein B0H19DRAFT_70960 [Mycena capillaripes]|nr:hypothetical protein B0H19DRAFT_70960 [Mycena capillaripes]